MKLEKSVKSIGGGDMGKGCSHSGLAEMGRAILPFLESSLVASITIKTHIHFDPVISFFSYNSIEM